MRALHQNEIDYLLRRGIFKMWSIPEPKNMEQKRVGVERSLRKLGLLEVAIPIAGHHTRTVYNVTKKGIQAREKLRKAYRALELTEEIRKLKEL